MIDLDTQQSQVLGIIESCGRGRAEWVEAAVLEAEAVEVPSAAAGVAAAVWVVPSALEEAAVACSAEVAAEVPAAASSVEVGIAAQAGSSAEAGTTSIMAAETGADGAAFLVRPGESSLLP